MADDGGVQPRTDPRRPVALLTVAIDPMRSICPTAFTASASEREPPALAGFRQPVHLVRAQVRPVKRAHRVRVHRAQA